MARRISNETKLKRGWGKIDPDHPEKYHPWIVVSEMSSGDGRKHMFADFKYPSRTVHLFSDLEKAVYEMLRANPNIVEVYEQVPLDLNTTKLLSVKYDIVHPRMKETGKLVVMTTDFLALVEFNGIQKYKAYSVKYSKDLKDCRTAEKLWLEKEFWEMHGIAWEVITEEDIK